MPTRAATHFDATVQLVETNVQVLATYHNIPANNTLDALATARHNAHLEHGGTWTAHTVRVADQPATAPRPTPSATASHGRLDPHSAPPCSPL